MYDLKNLNFLLPEHIRQMNWMEDWIRNGRFHSEGTRETYKINLKAWLTYLVDHQIALPKEETVIQFIQWMSKQGIRTSTINNRIATLRSFYHWAEHHGLYPDIAMEIENEKSESDDFRKKDLSVDQITRLLETCDPDTLSGKRDYAMLLILFSTGLRISSLLGADIGDIEEYETVEFGIQHYLRYKNKGTQGKTSIVMIPDAAYQALQTYENARFKGGNHLYDAPLFASCGHRNNGKRLASNTVRKLFKEKLRAIGLITDQYSLHSTRHTALTIAMRETGDLYKVARTANHKSLDTTQRYLHRLERYGNDTPLVVMNRILESKNY